MSDIEVMSLVVNVLIIAVSFLVLNWASNLTINNSLKVSRITRLGKTAIGFSLIAFTTSLPELTVAAVAVISGGAPLAVGNVLGSNIVNICLAVGLAALILYMHQRNKNKDHKVITVIPNFAKQELSNIHFGLLVSSIIPLILIYVVEATWVVGLMLISVFGIYMYQMAKVRMPEAEKQTVTKDERKKLKRYVLLTIIGALSVVISANFLVDSAVSIAQSMGISQTVIGATIIAIGTSLPELTLGLKAFVKGHAGLALGDIIGSSFVNITLILGITLFLPALLGNAITMNMVAYQNIVIFSIIINMFFWYFLSQGKLKLKEGLLFLFIYLLFIATTIGLL